MNISELEQAFLATEKVATPHRLPDFKEIRKNMLDTKEQLSASLVFLEEHNTGYRGNLERWFVSFTSKTGPIMFQIDLLPGLITRA
jgi:hypothetical protein